MDEPRRDHVRDPAGDPDLGLRFGTAAENYERFRRVYDDAVFSAVARYANRPLRTAVEVGAGTGKATRLFASHGVAVTAIEPDSGMVAELRVATAGLPVAIAEATFEGFGGEGPFDLLFAAAAWHWTDPATRWQRAMALLDDDGVIALFGTPGGVVDADLEAAVDAVETELLGEDAAQLGVGWTSEDIAAAGFTDIWELRLPGRVSTSVSDFVGRLSTVSAYLALDTVHRDEALRRVAEVLPERFEIDTTLHLTLARQR